MVMILDDLPEDMPTFMARLGTDQQCQEYLFVARWPDGFRCAACGHGEAYALKTKIVYECMACGKQHSLLAGTIFEQARTGLGRWFLAIYLVTSSKRGISAMKLKRQMSFASYGTAWTWLHKIHRAMLAQNRKPFGQRVEAGKTLARLPNAGATSRSISAPPRAGLLTRVASRLDRSSPDDRWGDAVLRLPAIHLVFSLAKRWPMGAHHVLVSPKHLQAVRTGSSTCRAIVMTPA